MTAVKQRKKNGPLSKIKRVLLYTVMIVSSVGMCMPFFWMLSASLKPETEVFGFPIKWIPETFRFQNYIDVWTQIPFLTYYRNTIVAAFSITLLQVVTCSLAAYAFTKINFPERNKIFLVYLSTMMVPFHVIMIPQFFIIKGIGLVDHLGSIILLGAFSAFGVFLFRQFFMTIPDSLSEAARVDGCSDFGIYSRIIMPLAKPAIASLVIFTFVNAWNDFLGPLIYLNSDSVKTLQLGIRSFQTMYSSSYALIMAAATCATLPVIIVYLFAQDQFVEGIAASGIKG